MGRGSRRTGGNVATPAARPTRDETPTATVEASRCIRPSCRSTDRDGYGHTRELPLGGTTSAGEAYTHVVWRRTRCRKCGQVRDDKSFENRLSA